MSAFYKLLKVLAIFAVLLPSLAWAGAAKIEKIGAGAEVKVLRGTSTLKLKEGDSLEAGDELTTDANTAVDLRLEDDSLVRVGVNSAYKVQQDSKLHLLVHRLISGAVRVLVKPTENDKKEASAIKFKMNTPEGTIGVRGTEFVVISGGGKTEVKGLDGEVVFGANNADFNKAGNYVLVSRGFSSYIRAGAKAAAKPEKFDLKAYLDDIGGKSGAFAPLAARVSGGNKHVRASVAEKKNVAQSAIPPKVRAQMKEAAEKIKKEADAAGEKGKLNYQHILLVAAQEGDIARAEDALKHKANINGKGNVGHTALQIAMLNDKEEMFIYLIRHGANVDAEDDNGHTPLMFVATNGLDVAYARALVNPGAADYEKRDRSGFSALDLAKAAHHADLVEYLSSKEMVEDSVKALQEKNKN